MHCGIFVSRSGTCCCRNGRKHVVCDSISEVSRRRGTNYEWSVAIQLTSRSWSTDAGADEAQVQKSMARTKQVLSERRHAIIGAAKILRARGDAAAAEELMKQGAEFDNIDSATV